MNDQDFENIGISDPIKEDFEDKDDKDEDKDKDDYKMKREQRMAKDHLCSEFCYF